MQARTELWHEEVDKEGFTVKTYRVYKNNEVDTFTVRIKGAAKKPEKHIYPLDHNRRIISRTLDHEGFTVTVGRAANHCRRYRRRRNHRIQHHHHHYRHRHRIHNQLTTTNAALLVH
jgi:hypothetical protein